MVFGLFHARLNPEPLAATDRLGLTLGERSTGGRLIASRRQPGTFARVTCWKVVRHAGGQSAQLCECVNAKRYNNIIRVLYIYAYDDDDVDYEVMTQIT